MQWKNQKDAYNKVIQNSACMEHTVCFSKKLKLMAYFIANMALNRYSPVQYSKIHVSGGKTLLRMVGYEDYVDFYYGDSQQTIRDIVDKKTYFTGMKAAERIRSFCNAIKLYYRQRREGPLVYWMDYYFWKEFLFHSKIEELLSDGHYDRLTSMLSFLCKEKGIKFIMRQHGLVSMSKKINLPNKLYCDKVIVFSEDDIEVFQTYIENKTCRYVVEYRNNVTFVSVRHKGNAVGIIENPMPETAEIISYVKEQFQGRQVMVYIMLHPISDPKSYKRFESENIVITRKKIWNLDMVVSPVSSLAYDYIRCGYKKPVLFFDKYGLKPEYQNKFPNLTYISQPERLKEAIQNVTF